MYKLTETVATLTGPVWVQIRWGPNTERGKWVQVPSLTKKLSISDLQLLAKEKLVFSSGVSLGLLTTLLGIPYAQEWMENTK